jgi:5-(carboxyamino)imidazole ribonucleotide synthase
MSGGAPVLGILGAGQLGRMLALAAGKLGIATHVYGPPGDTPAAAVSAAFTEAQYTDEKALAAFAAKVSVVTYEFENVPARTAEVLSALKPVRPGPGALAICQDRWIEKRFLQDLGIMTAPFANLEQESGIAPAAAAIGFPAIVKTRRMGYDGKGQRKVGDLRALQAAWHDLGRVPMILEGFVPFRREISVVGARAVDGAVASYDPVENTHENHILRTTIAPAPEADRVRPEAFRMTRHILDALSYVGVMGVEMFETSDGRLLVNEMAPRVHNSGHWTLDACAVSQFEQHVRAVMGWPLGSPERHSDAVMTNLLGEEALGWDARLPPPGTSLHLYGKAGAQPGRKMGHLTALSPRKD